jgi:hypothetical protein
VTSLTVRPADAYAALRVIADAAKAAAEVVLEENVVPAAAAVGATTFTTPFGKVYTSTTEAHVEILASGDLRAWLVENLPEHPDNKNLPVRDDRLRSIIPEHDEDTFDEHQLRRAVKAYVASSVACGEEDAEVVVVKILRAAFPPRTVPEQIAGWVIPYLTERARIVTTVGPGDGDDDYHEDRYSVVDGVTGEEWPWATAVPKKVTWNGRFDKEKKAETTGLILEQVNQFATLVGVKEIGA